MELSSCRHACSLLLSDLSIAADGIGVGADFDGAVSQSPSGTIFARFTLHYSTRCNAEKCLAKGLFRIAVESPLNVRTIIK